MPNKKYKIAVIQLNLNDVAENNLKKCLSCDAANQALVITLTRIIVAIISVRVKTLTILLWQSRYSTSFIAFSALAKELGVVIIVPFSKKNGWCLSQ
jgi:N-carbamoylputrescine amidase